MSSPSFFGEGNSPRVTDTLWRILQKILGATIDGGGGGGGSSFEYWEDTGPTPSGPPPDQTQVYTVLFRDSQPSKTWDPGDLAWH